MKPTGFSSKTWSNCATLIAGFFFGKFRFSLKIVYSCPKFNLIHHYMHWDQNLFHQILWMLVKRVLCMMIFPAWTFVGCHEININKFQINQMQFVIFPGKRIQCMQAVSWAGVLFYVWMYMCFFQLKNPAINKSAMNLGRIGLPVVEIYANFINAVKWRKTIQSMTNLKCRLFCRSQFQC